MSTKSDRSKRPRRLKTPIEPIHVEELLAGAGMSGFLGVLDPPAHTTHLEKLVRGADVFLPIPPTPRGIAEAAQPGALECDGRPARRSTTVEMTARVASVVGKMKALTELIKVAATKEK